MHFGKKTFAELEQLKRNGYYFQGVHHEIEIVFCCDWKAGACIEGLNSATSNYFCRYRYCTKDEKTLLRGDCSKKFVQMTNFLKKN